MKGFMIYEAPLWGDEENTVYLQEVNNASYTLKQIGSDDITCYLEGIATKDPVTKATCNKDDSYDFEVGALISLMRSCGVEKVKKAAKETFFDVAENAVNEYEEKIDALEEEINRLNSVTVGLYKSNSRLIDEIDQKNHEIISLKAENEKLKLDCEKLQHGYIDTDMIFCGGRQNGKQYTFLVDLFKKIPKDKVQAAYIAAYKESLIWCTSQPSIRDSLIEESRAFTRKCVDEWLYGPSTKREQMWNDILACGDCEHSKYVEVKKEDLETFAKECNEKKIFSISGYEFHLQKFWFDDDSCIFQIFRKPAGFICATDVSFASEDTIVDYLPPMRWDLFEKGRLVVKVDTDNYEDFYNKCEVEIGRKPLKACDGTFTVYYGKGTFHRKPYKDDIPFAKKIVNWEDVR